jgi:hypothetical protein
LAVEAVTAARLPRVGALVLVRWEDADGVLERSAGDRDSPTPEADAETVGWLCKRTRRKLHVACERFPRGCRDRYRGVTRIPIGWVREVVRIA